MRAGAVGQLRKVLVEYNQDWLMKPLERESNKQAGVAHRSRARRQRRLGRRHRHARRALARVHHRTSHRIGLRGPDELVAGRRLDDDANDAAASRRRS